MPLRTFSGRFVAVVGGVLVFASRLWGGFFVSGVHSAPMIHCFLAR